MPEIDRDDDVLMALPPATVEHMLEVLTGGWGSCGFQPDVCEHCAAFSRETKAALSGTPRKPRPPIRRWKAGVSAETSSEEYPFSLPMAAVANTQGPPDYGAELVDVREVEGSATVPETDRGGPTGTPTASGSETP